MAIFVGYFLAYISRWFILFLPQLSELFLFPTFKQDSRNIFGKRLSVFALSTMRYSFRWENLSHLFDIRKSSIFADFIRISNNFSETTAYCKSLISIQIILQTRDFPLWNSLLINIRIFVINWFRITADPSSGRLIQYFIFILLDVSYLSSARISYVKEPVCW